MNELSLAFARAENSRYAVLRLEAASNDPGTQRNVTEAAGSFWGWLVHCLKCNNRSYVTQLRNDRLSMLGDVPVNKLIDVARERKVHFIESAVNRGDRREYQRLMLELIRLEEGGSSASGGNGSEPTKTSRVCDEDNAGKVWQSSKFHRTVGKKRMAGLLSFDYGGARQPYKSRSSLPSNTELAWVCRALNKALQEAVSEPGSKRAGLTEDQGEHKLAGTQELQTPARMDMPVEQERKVNILNYLTVLGGATDIMQNRLDWRTVGSQESEMLWEHCQSHEDVQFREPYEVKIRVPGVELLEAFHKLDDFVREPHAPGISQAKAISLERIEWVKNKADSGLDPLGTQIEAKELFWLCSAYEEYMAVIGGTSEHHPEAS